MSTSSSANRAPQVVALGIPLIIIPTVAIALRIWSRMLIYTSGSSRARVLWWDDWLVMMGLPLSLATTSLDLSWTTFGFGKHMAVVSEPDLLKGMRVLWSILWLYSIAIWLSKLSALAFYARVFSPGNKRFHLALWIVAGLASIWIVAVLVSLILLCDPPRKAWEPGIPGTCQDDYKWWLASDIGGFLLDLIILLLPLPMLWRLQVKPSRKGLIVGVFMSGYSVVFVSLGHVIVTVQEKPAHGPFLADITYDLIPSGKWLSVESPIAIFCLCLPAIFALVKKGIDDGPRALFRLSTKPASVQSHTDRVTMLRQASDDGDAFDNTNLYALPPLRTPGMSAAANATASGKPLSADGSRKGAGVTVHDPNVIHVQTDIRVETRSTWVELMGVDI